MFLFAILFLGDVMDINKILFLAGVSTELLDKATLTTCRHRKNQTVYAQGDTCGGIDIVLSGRLVAYSLSQKGSESVVFTFGKDSVIGANLLFGNANRYPMNIYCTEDCELLHIKKTDVEALLHDYNFAVNFIKSISLNSQGMNQKIAMFTQKSLRENLTDYLLALSAEQQSQTVMLPMSKKQLADYLGVQRPSLFRELKAMKDEGLIEIENKIIIIKRL